MKFAIYTLTLILAGCSFVDIEEFNQASNNLSLNDIIVPEGFDYAMTANQNVNVKITASSSRNEDISYQYAILGTDDNGDIHNFQMGNSGLGEMHTSIEKPNHVSSLYLYTKHKGNAKVFDLSNGSIDLQYQDLLVNEGTSSNSRQMSTPTCISFLGNATWIKCVDGNIRIHSSASILKVEAVTDDGDTLTITTSHEDVQTNSNSNIWDLIGTIEDIPLSEVNNFHVYANCSVPPKDINLELVSFANPCNPDTDADSDGVADSEDVTPYDSNNTMAIYLPAKDRFATYAFEDLWPNKGDFDFNDLVVYHNATVYSNESGYVNKVFYQIKIEAAGASFDNSLCVSFSDADHNMALSETSESDLQYAVHRSDQLSEVRISNIKQAFSTGGFVNSDTTMSYHDPIIFNFTALFDGSILVDDFKIDEFLRVNEVEGREVHKPGRSHTSLADLALFGTADDDTRPNDDKYYKSHDNLPWALEIPTTWEYPKEGIDLTMAYPRFKDFAQGKSNSPWYTDEEGNKVHKHLYKKPR